MVVRAGNIDFQIRRGRCALTFPLSFLVAAAASSGIFADEDTAVRPTRLPSASRIESVPPNPDDDKHDVVPGEAFEVQTRPMTASDANSDPAAFVESAAEFASPWTTDDIPTNQQSASVRPADDGLPASVTRLVESPTLGVNSMLDPYRGRVMDQPPGKDGGPTRVTSFPIDTDVLWWQEALKEPLGIADQEVPVDVSWLTHSALVSSPLVKSLLARPQIDRTSVVIADAEFDPTLFLQGKFVDTSEPIGSVLTTGAREGRFRDETFAGDAGVQRKLRSGGMFEAIQRGGFQQNNSQFLVPNPQGTTRLELNYSQPLLQGRGKAVSEIRILLAQLDVRSTDSEVRQELESHLLLVTQAYWELFRSRSEWLQRTKLLRQAESLHRIVSARQAVDSMQRQLFRAESALTSRRTGLRSAEAAIRDAQARIRMLTGNEALLSAPNAELTPQESPPSQKIPIETRDAAITALENRADLAIALTQIRATTAKIGVAKNQVLPRLDLLLSTYVAGLDANRNTFGAFANQFSEGRPSYAAGLRYELPWGNRAAKARLNRNRWQLTRVIEEFRQTTEKALVEVEIATRETETSYAELSSKYQAILAADREVKYLRQRYEQVIDPDLTASDLIDDLLDAQQRLFEKERDFVGSQVEHAMSWVRLRRSMGVLLRLTHDKTLDTRSANSDSTVWKAEGPSKRTDPLQERNAPMELSPSTTPAPEFIEDSVFGVAPQTDAELHSLEPHWPSLESTVERPTRRTQGESQR
ncbi:MAG: TolC family protein [Planctomycetota bacterium]